MPPVGEDGPARLVQFSPPYDPSELREKTRSWIAKALVLLLAVVAVTLLGLIAAGWVEPQEALAYLGALTAIVGTALGFYFGGQSN